jgi:hypothetical protein
MSGNRWGCTVCGFESKTGREMERHFDAKHKGTDFEEEPGWRDYFLGKKKRNAKRENRNVSL